MKYIYVYINHAYQEGVVDDSNTRCFYTYAAAKKALVADYLDEISRIGDEDSFIPSEGAMFDGLDNTLVDINSYTPVDDTGTEKYFIQNDDACSDFGYIEFTISKLLIEDVKEVE